MKEQEKKKRERRWKEMRSKGVKKNERNQEEGRKTKKSWREKEKNSERK